MLLYVFVFSYFSAIRKCVSKSDRSVEDNDKETANHGVQNSTELLLGDLN